MRSKKALLNFIYSLLLQLVTVVSSFIIPIYIIGTFGSNVNGVIVSITQFLSYITLLESGVGGVVRAALYKPLAIKDVIQVSRIVKATEKFFKIIAYLFIVYIFIIAFLFPSIISGEFDGFYLTTLVLIIGTSTFIQYYFGITYSVLLQADQRRYITSVFQILTLIANTIITVVLINLGFGIHIVMLGSATIFVFRPILLQIYVKRRYKLLSNCEEDKTAIKQRWDGLGHHIAFFLHRNTAVVVLTLFTNIREVSVYSVYYMVVIGVQKLVNTLSSGVEAAFGNMIAKGEKTALDRNFRLFEFISYTATTVLFTSAGLLILPFIGIYTEGITDADYYRPLFAYILVATEAIYCIRLPYHAVVLAAGHFKQTKKGAYTEAIINIALSIILVNFIGILGVAIATFVAMIFRTVQYAIYLSRNILQRNLFVFIKRTIVSLIGVAMTVSFTQLVPTIEISTYIDWVFYAIIITTISITINILLSLVFYIDDVKRILNIVKSFTTKRKKKKK
ncbi:lipopolysaccharide biosynthesis protein [Peribacillus butanolivorans]|uniref:Sugar isomerase n=1 Tax=Peribacillus butanolivorans TaxID=421767 RepID=A0ABM6XH10_9BACI|nr:sugar isomerase [Peribacillus butanolivorans]AXN37653.1 sugar isomerase [Peribacillus butanolivorans]